MRYGEHRSVPVSVVVRISEQRRWIESAALLAAGKPVRETDLAVKSGLRFALSPSPPADPGQFAGRLPRRNIPSGATLVPSMFADALIARGETVSVEVSSGAVSLRFEGRAESGGRADDRILVLDPARGLRIKAKVVASGKVLVDADQNRTHAALRAAGDSGGGLE
jgi:flagella basal body P-ring formation protein FlgA